MYIYMHMDAPFCDVVLVVRTWMRCMMCYMFVLHVYASSLRMFGHVDAPCVFYVFLWFMYMDANVDALQYFLGFYIF